MNIWLDYSVGRPSGIALQTNGITGVIRYVGLGSASKRLTRQEYLDLIGHGIQVHGVAELHVDTSNGGYTRGLADAQATMADVLEITDGNGLPVVYASNDQQHSDSNNVEYVRAFRDVFGHAHTGCYGFAAHIHAVMRKDYASHYWLAGSPPSVGNLTGLVDLWQRQGHESGLITDGPGNPTLFRINQTTADINTAFDRTPPPIIVAPTPFTEDEEMFITCTPQGKQQSVALLTGPFFVGLTGHEVTSAQTAIKNGATVLDVNEATWTELDKRSHEVCDNPRPVNVTNPPAATATAH